MDSESLKIILELKEENTLYKRVIGEMLLIVNRGEAPLSMEYNIKDDALHFLYSRLVERFCNKCNNPSNNTDNPGNSGC